MSNWLFVPVAVIVPLSILLIFILLFDAFQSFKSALLIVLNIPFALIGGIITLVGLAPIVRFLWFWSIGQGNGHIQSLVLGGSLLVLGVLTGLMGLLAELIGANRKLLEATLSHVRKLEEKVANLERRGDESRNNRAA